MALNQKDKNLFRALVFLLILCLMTGAGALWLFGGDPLRAVGGLVVAYAGVRLLLAARKALLTKPVDPKAFGKWALVTGCTGGLGQEFAHRCASRGLDLVLVSRSRGKLEALAKDLRAAYGVRAVVLVFDFAKSSCAEEEAFYGTELPRFLASEPVCGDVALLVNNVGVGDEAPFAVEEITVSDIHDMVKVNCGAIVNMSKAVLPLFKHRRAGAVINVSSGSCAQPSPYLATYASSKAFDLHFSKSCSREYREFGVHVLGIRPYYISGTGLYPNAKPSFNAPAKRDVVEGAFSHLGRYDVSHAWWVHSVMGYIFGTIWEDPVFGAVLGRLAKRAKLNGTMLMIQKAARKRSKEKNVNGMWNAVDAASAGHRRNLGIEAAAK
jgi:17beta-estradiol 17-dehydrogenase / very-long-chain 3-oxoacyl-CoA reductase